MAGKRASSSTRTREPSSGLPLGALGLAVGITLALVAWGYLVYLAIDFGTAARAGDGGGWALLILAALGATACLFIGLILVGRITAVLGLSRSGRAEARRDRGRATPSYAATPAATPRFDPSSWDHTRPAPAGSRQRIVPSASGSSSPDPTTRTPVPTPARTPAAAQGPRTPTAAGGRRAAPRNGRIARPSRRDDRPPGGRRAAR